MNNEPVAWVDEETGCFVYSKYDYEDLDEHGKDGLIPLYTRPIEQLSDEPIGQLCTGCGSSWSDEQLAEEKLSDDKLISCCPDREMVNVYTRPSKQLSDEEILSKVWAGNFDDNHCLGFTEDEFLNCVRAIIKEMNNGF